MKLLKELIEALSAPQPNLTDALIRTKVLLHKLGRKDLAEWVNLELNGYEKGGDVPSYRIVHAQIMGSVSNGVYQHANHPLPTMHLEEGFRKKLEELAMRDSVSVLEELAKKDTKGLTRNIPIEANGVLSEALGNGFEVQRAWSAMGTGRLAEVLTQIRSRLLDFLLELSEKVDDDMSAAAVKQIGQSSDTSSMFNNAIFGDNATIVVGDNNRQSVANKIKQGDLEGLLNALRDAKMPDEGVQELRIAIQEDSAVQADGATEFGPKVKGWMKNMLGRVVENSWQIEMNIAANLMTDALKAFYGV